jgi:hypothetical protein
MFLTKKQEPIILALRDQQLSTFPPQITPHSKQNDKFDWLLQSAEFEFYSAQKV